MTPGQTERAQQAAREVQTIALKLAERMSSIIHAYPHQLDAWDIKTVKNAFAIDAGMGVQDRVNQLQSIVNRTQATLETGVTTHDNGQTRGKTHESNSLQD